MLPNVVFMIAVTACSVGDIVGEVVGEDVGENVGALVGALVGVSVLPPRDIFKWIDLI